MEVITSPVDILAFEYIRAGVFTIVNNLWTWVAFITAAVSFWRIRNGGSSAAIVETITPVASPALETTLEKTTGTAPIERKADGFSQPAAETSVPAAKVKECMAAGFDDVDHDVTKGKFVAYYLGDRGDYGDVGMDVDEELAELSNGDVNGEWWERLTKVRMGEMGWYRYQDLTAINGNVVRLWDGVRRESCRVW